MYSAILIARCKVKCHIYGDRSSAKSGVKLSHDSFRIEEGSSGLASRSIYYKHQSNASRQIRVLGVQWRICLYSVMLITRVTRCRVNCYIYGDMCSAKCTKAK